MSGPIIRKYGFANFEKIFGERELKHGAEARPSTPPPAPSPDEPAKATPGEETPRNEAKPPGS